MNALILDFLFYFNRFPFLFVKIILFTSVKAHTTWTIHFIQLTQPCYEYPWIGIVMMIAKWHQHIEMVETVSIQAAFYSETEMLDCSLPSS